MQDSVTNTANDEAIARVIAESYEAQYEGNRSLISSNHGVTAETRLSSVANCPGRHGLRSFQTPPAQRVNCNGCSRRLEPGETVYSCVACDFDTCPRCYHRSGNSSISSRRNSAPPVSGGYPASRPTTPPPARTTFGEQTASHMCNIPCMIGEICTEMMVDTGAQTSVLSYPLVRQFGLMNRLDRSTVGVAAGVGRARIIGTVRNVICSFGEGHVEFVMDFMVLDVQDQLMILGLDQMRKYKCLVDVGREVLIFGGTGGVEVHMLPPNQQRVHPRSVDGCVIM